MFNSLERFCNCIMYVFKQRMRKCRVLITFLCTQCKYLRKIILLIPEGGEKVCEIQQFGVLYSFSRTKKNDNRFDKKKLLKKYRNITFYSIEKTHTNIYSFSKVTKSF